MGKSYKRKGVFGEYTEHFNDSGKKIGESRERQGFFGKYVEHTNASGRKLGESREREGLFGPYTEHSDKSHTRIGLSRHREGVFEKFVEHSDASDRKVGESRSRQGLFNNYTEHTGKIPFLPAPEPEESRKKVSSSRNKSSAHTTPNTFDFDHSYEDLGDIQQLDNANKSTNYPLGILDFLSLIFGTLGGLFLGGLAGLIFAALTIVFPGVIAIVIVGIFYGNDAADSLIYGYGRVATALGALAGGVWSSIYIYRLIRKNGLKGSLIALILLVLGIGLVLLLAIGTAALNSQYSSS